MNGSTSPIIFYDKWFFKKLRREAQNAHSDDPNKVIGPDYRDDEAEEDRKILIKFYGKNTPQYKIIYEEVYIHILALIEILFQEPEYGNLRKAYRQLVQFEWLAQVELDKKRYRDHLTHPAKVTMLGLWFLFNQKIHATDLVIPILKTQTKDYRRKHGIHICDWKDFLRKTWIVTGLLHDFCYPMEFVLKQCGKLENSKSYRIWFVYNKQRYYLSDLFKKVEGSFFLSQIDPNLKRAKRKIVQAVSKGRKDQNHLHAVLGALNLLMFCLHDDSLHTQGGLMFQLAASAIFGHHEGKPVSFNDHPIDFLLVLCDTLQEWGRDFFIKRSAKGNRWIINNYLECDAVEATLNSVPNSIDFKFNTPSLYIRSKTGWKKKIFEEGKEKDLKLFNKHGSFPEIRFKV